MGVIDNAVTGAIAPMPQRFVKETFHGKAVEATVKSYIAHFTVTQVKAAGNNLLFFPTDNDRMLRCVMLHLLARDVRHMAGTLLMFYTQTHIAYQPGERGVTNRYVVFLGQYFMHTLYVALTILVKLC